MNNTNSIIGQYELIIKDLINPYNPIKNIAFDKVNKSNAPIPMIKNEIINNLNNTQINKLGNDSDPNFCEYSNYQQKKIKELESQINMLGDKFISDDYKNKIMKNYLEWINKIRLGFINEINDSTLYYFYKFDSKNYNLHLMQDYWDVPETDKLFSFSLFISNPDNLTYMIGLVYNYVIMKKHFSQYKMRIYIDYHSVFGSAETFNLFNMFIDILEDIDPTYNNTIQMIVFFLNPYYQVNGESIYESIVYDIHEIKNYYNKILYNTNNHYIKSPLLDLKLEENESKTNSSNPTNSTNSTGKKNNIGSESKSNKKNISINIDDLEINYKNIGEPSSRSSFSMFSTHLAVNLRFLPLNENCEFHVRDLDSRLSLTDINIINKFANPKYEYVPFYVFQFYKFYFPYLKWRIDVNPYLAGCFGGNNKKTVMISKELEQSGNLKILKKEIFFKYILFISFNATNLQIGFLNDEFILANIFERIKGNYSENILYLNLGSFANKHVNEYYYGISNSNNYPCILKLGVPIDILRYPLNGKYLTIDPITDFKIGSISIKYHNIIKNLITEQLNIYLKKTNIEKISLANKIRKNYKSRLEDKIDDDLEGALFFSMIPKSYTINGLDDVNSSNYTIESYTNQFFSSIGDSTVIMDNEKLKATNIMMVGYLLADIMEEIIFPQNPQFINSNYYLSDDNYDRLFNCMYFDESKKKFIQRKINKNDLSRKYVDQNIISHIPEKLLEFSSKEQVKNSLNNEFNNYLLTCNYYPSLSWYINKISFNNFIDVDGKQIKSGILVFIKNYTEPIYDKQNNLLYMIEDNGVKTLKYKLGGSKDSIKAINIDKNKLKFNVILIDDKNINQFNYNNTSNKDSINIKLLKSSHLNKLADIINSNKYRDFLLIDNL
jgi:hypothetical protein